MAEQPILAAGLVRAAHHTSPSAVGRHFDRTHGAAVSVATELKRTLVPFVDERHGPLPPMLVALTLLTGVVDATSYLKLGHVFVANMTGNVVFLGFALAGAHGLSAMSSLLALATFMLGALLGGWLGARSAEHRGRMLRAANSVQALLILGALLLALLAREPFGTGVRYGVIALLALAMGVQNAAALRIAIPELTTTVLTRTLTGIASEARIVGGAGSRVGARGVAVIAMLLGAIGGGLLVLHVSIAASVAVALALASLVALAAHTQSGSSAAWTRS